MEFGLLLIDCLPVLDCGAESVSSAAAHNVHVSQTVLWTEIEHGGKRETSPMAKIQRPFLATQVTQRSHPNTPEFETTGPILIAVSRALRSLAFRVLRIEFEACDDQRCLLLIPLPKVDEIFIIDSSMVVNVGVAGDCWH
jgi:hypothetical protein